MGCGCKRRPMASPKPADYNPKTEVKNNGAEKK